MRYNEHPPGWRRGGLRRDSRTSGAFCGADDSGTAPIDAANFDVDFATGRAAFDKAGVQVDPSFLHFSGIDLGSGDAIDVAYRASLVQIERLLAA